MMTKATLAALGVLAALPAAAHEMGGAHLHPHVDPALLMAALIATGVAVWAFVSRK